MNRYAIIGPDGFPLDHHFEFLASNNIIYVHILPSGGRRPDGSVYESDYDAGINRFFSNLREKKLEIKRILWDSKPSRKKHDEEFRRLQIVWPDDFDELGPDKFRRKIAGQLSSKGGGNRGAILVEIHSHSKDLPENEIEALLSGIESKAEELPKTNEEARSKVLRLVYRRRGQPRFRNSLLEAYGRRCAITSSNATEALEAAHIRPFGEGGSMKVSNGLLLRADIHTLFDLNYITIDPDSFKIELAVMLHGTDYSHLHGEDMNLPEVKDRYPSKNALIWHNQFSKKTRDYS